ncbi:MAG: type 1 glutamine amidotransferase [Paracoccaceae bacterium]
MKIGILQCGHTVPEIQRTHGNFPEMFERLLGNETFSYESFDIEGMAFPDSVTQCDGWLLTGSVHAAYQDHAFIPPLEAFIQAAYAAHIPMVGICFGHQIIAQALGGHVEKFEGGWMLGLKEYDFDGLGPVFQNAWHEDQVLRIPDGAVCVASNADCAHAALVYDTRAFTVQFHPEFDGKLITDYVRLRRGTKDYPDDRMNDAARRSGEADSNAMLARRIAAFFLQHRIAPRDPANT